MWRNFSFPCMTIVGKLKISPHVEKFQYNWLGFIAIYAVLLLNLLFTLFCREIFATIYTLSCEEKLSPKVQLCRKNDKYQVWIRVPPFIVNTPLLAINIVERRTEGWRSCTNQFNNLVLNCSFFGLFCSKRIRLGLIWFSPFFLQAFITSAQKEFQTRSRDVLRCKKFPCRETLLLLLI